MVVEGGWDLNGSGGNEQSVRETRKSPSHQRLSPSPPPPPLPLPPTPLLSMLPPLSPASQRPPRHHSRHEPSPRHPDRNLTTTSIPPTTSAMIVKVSRRIHLAIALNHCQTDFLL